MSVCAVVAAVPVHEEMSWLNAEAEENIPFIFVTSAVFQPPMSWLNEDAPLNITDIVATEDVSQRDTSPSN